MKGRDSPKIREKIKRVFVKLFEDPYRGNSFPRTILVGTWDQLSVAVTLTQDMARKGVRGRGNQKRIGV